METMKTSPIGIFDSGIGGLTVAHAIHKALPKEQLIYFGDTAHLPYGDKSPDSIKYYSIRIAQFLLEHGCKMIVIACNTASAHAYETVKDFVGKRAVVINVIDPLVAAVAKQKKWNKVGVIATKGTVKADSYAKKIKTAAPQIQVSSLATPLLAPMIEEGFFNNKISRTVIGSYLDHKKLQKIDALLLACTHYPLIKEEIMDYYKNNITVLDSAGLVAEAVVKVLRTKKWMRAQSGSHQFYVSDFTPSFQESTKYFFGSKITLHKAAIWK
ncbi:MAG: hypothetical protein RIQ89_1327 [Bacteroidota bacterium]|jgi:glutamate racemase